MLARAEILGYAYYGRQLYQLFAEYIANLPIQYHHRHLDPGSPITSRVKVAHPNKAQVCNSIRI